MSTPLKQALQKFEGDLRRHICEDVSQLKARLDRGNFDFLHNDLLAKPDGFDGIVFATRSKLRRWSSGQNKGS